MSLPAPMKLFIGAIIVVLMGVGFYLVQWKPIYDEMTLKEQAIAEQESKISELERKKEEYPKVLDENQKLQVELQNVIQSQLTPESESEFVPSYIADIEKLVEQQRARMGDPDFQVVSLTPEANTRATGGPQALAGYPTRGFQMSLTGRYASVIDFLRQLSALKLKRLVTVSKINLTPNSTNSKDLNYFESPVLSITLPITVYLREDKGGK